MIYVAFRCGGWREGVWFVLVAGLVALLCDQFSSSVCKPFFERYRPARDPDFSSMVTIVNGYRGGMFGFFSSHAANAAGIVVYTALIFREFTIPEIFWPDYYGESLWDGVVFSYIRKCDLFSLAMFRLPIQDVVL